MAGEPINIADLERLAADALDPAVHAYFAGGAGDERTLRANVDAFGDWQLLPRVLVDVAEVSTATSVLGREVATPVLVAPVALQRLAHPDGEPATARAAGDAGTVMCVSTLATARPADVAAAAPDGRRWLQLYCFRDPGVTRALIDEAAASGYEAIALTVDAPYAGARERDVRAGFEIPADLRTPAIDAAVGSQDLTTREMFELIDPSLTWSDLEALVGDVDLPILVKGVMRGDDARLAAEHGAAAIVVSNHGGRQLDGVPASVEMLPEVVEAVAGRVEVLLDGGVRRGTDVAVAVALGARAVLVGRPVLWGLVVDGEAGARRALEILTRELELALALLGCPSPAELGAGSVRRRRPA